MIGKLQRKIQRTQHGKAATKFKFDLFIHKVVRIPSTVDECRVVWQKGAKLQHTDLQKVRDGKVSWNRKLTQIATIYRDQKGNFEEKEYRLKIQSPAKSNESNLVTIAVAKLDMAKLIAFDQASQKLVLPLDFKFGKGLIGELHVEFMCAMLRGAGIDDVSVVSEMTGYSAGLANEQDIEGFDGLKKFEQEQDPAGEGNRADEPHSPRTTVSLMEDSGSQASSAFTSPHVARIFGFDSATQSGASTQLSTPNSPTHMKEWELHHDKQQEMSKLKDKVQSLFLEQKTEELNDSNDELVVQQQQGQEFDEERENLRKENAHLRKILELEKQQASVHRASLETHLKEARHKASEAEAKNKSLEEELAHVKSGVIKERVDKEAALQMLSQARAELDKSRPRYRLSTRTSDRLDLNSSTAQKPPTTATSTQEKQPQPNSTDHVSHSEDDEGKQLPADLSNANSDLVASQLANAILEAQVNSLEQQIQKLQANLESVQSERNQLYEQLKQFENQQHSDKSKTDQNTMQLQELQAARQRISELAKQVTNLRDELDRANNAASSTIGLNEQAKVPPQPKRESTMSIATLPSENYDQEADTASTKVGGEVDTKESDKSKWAQLQQQSSIGDDRSLVRGERNPSDKVEYLRSKLAALENERVQFLDLRKDLGLDNGDDEKSEWGLVTLGGAWRKENNILMKELISRKLELAELNEQHVKVRCDLYKIREKNVQLSAKMTTLETALYTRR